MKLKFIAFSVFLCAALSMGASDCIDVTGPGTGIFEVTILHTNDIHSQFHPEPANSEKNPFGLGGLAKLKTLIDLRKSEKKSAVLLDAGDWAEGNAYYHIDAGSNILKIMDAMGYDATVVGNHDFLNGPTELLNTINRADVSPRLRILGANKDLSHPSLTGIKSEIEKKVQDYAVFDTGNGVRIGVIGLLCTDFAYYDYFKPAVISSAKDRAREIARKLYTENLADVIVLLSHNSFELNKTWAQEIPYINVIVSGHSHVKTAKPVVLSNAGGPVYVVEAKSWGQFLGEMTLYVDKKSRGVRLKNYTLHPVKSDLKENPTIASMIEIQDQLMIEKYGKDIIHDHHADCTDEFVQDEIRESALGNLVADAYRASIGADMGMESGSLIGIGISPGPLSTMDIMNIAPHIYQPWLERGYPFPLKGRAWKVVELTLTGNEILLLLNIPLKLDKVLPTGWISVSGARVIYSNNLNPVLPVDSVQVFNQVTRVYEPLDMKKSYTIAVHEGLLLALSVLKGMGIPIDLTRIRDSFDGNIVETWQALLKEADRQKVFRAQDYAQGFRFKTLEADLGFYEHNVSLKMSEDHNYFLEVVIQNQGLQRSSSGIKVKAYRSAPNDAVNDFTADNEKFLIGSEITISSLAPGATSHVYLPWNDMPQTNSVYSVRVELDGVDPAKDGSLSNNRVIRHIRIP